MGLLASAVQHEFESAVRQRGEQYYASDCVEIEKTGEKTAEGSAYGSDTYWVFLAVEDDRLVVYCTCPYYADHGPCKHLYAAIRAAEDQRYLEPPPGVRRLPVSFAEEDPDYENALGDRLDFDFDEDYGYGPDAPDRIPAKPTKRPAKPKAPTWKDLLTSAGGGVENTYDAPEPLPEGSRIDYVLDAAATAEGRGVAVDVLVRQRKKNGDWGVPRPRALTREQISLLPCAEDRAVLGLMCGATPSSSYGYSYYSGYGERSSRFLLGAAIGETVLPMLARTGRLHLSHHGETHDSPMAFDDGPPWQWWVEIRPEADGKHYALRGQFRRGDALLPIGSPALAVGTGWLFWPDRMARLESSSALAWMKPLQKADIRVPVAEADAFLEHLTACGAAPHLDLPPELAYEEIQGTPKPRLKVKRHKTLYDGEVLCCDLDFDYEAASVSWAEVRRGVFDPNRRRLVLRDAPAEAAAFQRLLAMGVRHERYGAERRLHVPTERLPKLVRTLVAEGWAIEASGTIYRRAAAFGLSVSSGVDWFELRGAADFGGVSAPLPQLLAALRKGEDSVRLDDGSLGLVPEEWLRKIGFMVRAGQIEKDHVRFARTQTALLDALLAAQPEATFDEGFARAREELRRFERIEPADPEPGFTGQLRPYQRDGLGWLHFLRQFSFGGCLADDMGLGKTVQVLALLESRRRLRHDDAAASRTDGRPGPSLAVVPRSLIFNWRQEAARFAPHLRVLDHSGTARTRDCTEHFQDYDLVLTTYGTLRRDIASLKDLTFDYLILDESQAIKNAATASAKAARLLRGHHRLALTGTPIENHIGELWSQFEFLNPGLLGGSAVLGGAAGHGAGLDEETRGILSRALRPFILRRTKAQVAADLPTKTEQTIFCQLQGEQRRMYDELRDHYRKTLLARVAGGGLAKAKIQVLEALLRLRQAACHIGLIDKSRTDETSAKLDALIPQLSEVADEGHKSLVFSQFTSLLAIVRNRLDEAGIAYEYLDGRTRNRQERVDRFQNDPACPVFLISLKAGGLGLNLTAAEYVFLLDPWWNPAVEAQAIDRTHRIGQTRQVFAYRLLARDTVEEKVIELQGRKRALADAILTADNSLIRHLKPEDLEFLLA